MEESDENSSHKIDNKEQLYRNAVDFINSLLQTREDLYKNISHIKENIDSLHKWYMAWRKSLTDYEKKILMYYADCSDYDIDEIYKKREQENKKWDEHIMVLKIYANQFVKAIQQYLEKDFFIQRLTYHDDKELQKWVDICTEKYPAVKSAVKYKYKNRVFHKMVQKQYSENYIQKAKGVITDLCDISQFPDLNSKEKIYAFFADRILSLFQNNTFEKFYNKHLYDCIEKEIQQSHKERVVRREYEIQQQEVKKDKKNIPIKTNIVGAQNSETQHKTPDIIQKIMEDLSDVLHTTMDGELKDLKNYLTRVYKKGTPVSIEAIAKHLWDKINEEACHILIEALPKLGLDIRDGEQEVNELINKILGIKKKTDTIQWEENKNRIQTPINITRENIKNDFSRQTTDSIKTTLYPTLEGVKQDTNMLNAELLVKIFKEMWYKILFEDEFIKSAEEHLNNIFYGKALKVDIIGKLSKPREHIRKSRKGVNGVSYQRMRLMTPWYRLWYRLAKQWNTIICFADFETYIKKVDQYFANNKKTMK